jgi:3-oxoadipate enol-lactonase
MAPPSAQHATSPSGLRIAYDDHGQGPPVVLVHGLGSHRRRWDGLTERLMAAGYRVVRPDLRGFGDSDASPTPYTAADLAGDVMAVVRATQLTRFHLVGHSLGGMVAQHLALVHGEALETLTLLATTSHNGRRASAFGRVMAEVAERGYESAVSDPDVRALLERTLAEAFPGGPPPLKLFRRGLEKPDPTQAMAWRATMDFSVKDRLQSLRVPVLVVHGTADPLIPCVMGELIQRAVAGARLHRMEGIGHHPHRDALDELSDVLLGHLTHHGADSRGTIP